jgi:glycogen operon protein
MLSQGVPMLLGGDEIGRTQRGNNNAYCQDNELSWYEWDDVDQQLFAFTRRLITIRREHPCFRRRHWFLGRPIRGIADLGWFRPDGKDMTDDDWNRDYVRAVGLYLNGSAIPGRDQRGQRIVDDSFLLLFNAHHEPMTWTLPRSAGTNWNVLVDTAAEDDDEPGPSRLKIGGKLVVADRSMQLLMQPRKA